MKNVSVYILILLFVLTGCESTSMAYYVPEEIVIRVVSQQSEGSGDVETAMENVSVFLASPSSGVISYKFIDIDIKYVEQGIAILLLEPSIVKVKDIYVITNYEDVNSLNEINQLEELKTLVNAIVFDESYSSLSENSMFGSLFEFDFENNPDVPVVTLTRISNETYTGYFLD